MQIYAFFRSAQYQVVGKIRALVEKETGKLLPRGLPPRPTHADTGAGFDLKQATV